jgi:coproporphyrinogen III oxidase-like Fe-S oxidoreductase
MLSLRISDGLSFDRLAKLGGADFAQRLFGKAQKLEKNGLLKIENGCIHLSDEGFLLSNSIIVHLMDC